MLRSLFRVPRLSKILPLVLVAAAAPATAAKADFLDDLFGGPDPAPRASAAAHGAYRRAAPARERAARSATRVRSELHFMPVARAKSRDDRDHHLTTVAKADAGESSAGSRPVVASLCAPESVSADAPATTLLAYDRTLRSGDIMMTDSGFRVFRGHAGCPHGAHDFIALTSANMARGKRNMLLAIEDATRGPKGYFQSVRLNTH